jgi:D-alanyl-D-alanine carboxypeptidase (penicillin-binding protein 5/6)
MIQTDREADARMRTSEHQWLSFVTRVALAAMLLLGLAVPAGAQPKTPAFETGAAQAFLYDQTTRTVLFEREADAKIPPASLAKLMTIALVFRELKEGRLTPEADMVVSVDAWRRGGAVSGNPNMLLTPNRVIKVGELLNGLIVGNANDAALTFAENIAGTEERFTGLMNAEAARLGLKTLVFRNATGYSDPEQSATLRDLVRLSAHVIDTYPELYALFAQRDMPLGKGRQVSRNPLLTMEIGADGLITGSHPEAGHALLGSAVQEGRRLIVGVAGLKTVQDRSLEARKLMEWGFRRFEIRDLFPAGARIGEVSVYGGASGFVAVTSPEQISLPLLRGTSEGTGLRIAYRGPVPAPIKAGATVARLEILVEGRVIQSVPLVAAENVAVGGILARARDAALEVSRQWSRDGLYWLLEKAGLGTKKATL